MPTEYFSPATRASSLKTRKPLHSLWPYGLLRAQELKPEDATPDWD